MKSIEYYKGYKQALYDLKAVCEKYRNMWVIAKDMPRMLEEERIMREIDTILMSFPISEVDK